MTSSWARERLRHRFIDCDTKLDITPSECVEIMRQKGYTCGYHFLLHDASAEKRGEP